MWLERFARISIVTGVAVVCAVVACGGDDGGGGSGSTPDAKIDMDAPAGSIDAPGSGSNVTGLGQSCTPPAQGSGQGDCPAGYICLNAEGATHPWCTKQCAQGSGDTCAQGYSGPGIASCIESISFNGQPAILFCGITCSGNVNGCTTTTCDGTCPSGLACSATLTGSGSASGSACQ